MQANNTFDPRRFWLLLREEFRLEYKRYLLGLGVVFGGLLMIWLADRVATFLQKNRMYEVLGLFVLFVVGILLLSEGGHLAHLHFFGHEITPMSKATFYFVISVLILTDIVQSRYQRRLLRRQGK